MTAVTDNSIPLRSPPSPSMTLKGAVLGGTGCWLLMLVPATMHLINQYMHPMALLFYVICIPLAGIAGMILGGITGWLTGRAMRNRILASTDQMSSAATNSESRFVVSGILVVLTGTLVAAATIYACLSIEYRPIAQVESVGGTYERMSGGISFDSGSLTDKELQEIVTAFNGFYLVNLDLADTEVTGDGVQCLNQIHQTGWTLVLTAKQVDENAIRHLSKVTGLRTLNIVSESVSAERLDEVAGSLPNVFVTHNGQLVSRQ